METDSTFLTPIEGVVNEEMQQLLHSPEVPLLGENPAPASPYESMSEAIDQNNVELAEYLLKQKLVDVANRDFPIEKAVRAKAFDMLEIFRRNGWDVNRPDRNEPPVLRY